MKGEPRRAATARLFLRGLGGIYAVAFASLAVQVLALHGSDGILPASAYLGDLASRFGAAAAATSHPTLFWFDASDRALLGACWAGAASGVLLALGRLPLPAAAACWALYLSLFQVGRVFLSFQWDLLLVETGFLAMLLAPWRLALRRGEDPEPPVAVVWLLRWLLFRLMFSSGVVKLASGDPAWWGLEALEYHYWTQPLPTWTAWFAWQLPSVVHRACVVVMFVVELFVPFLVFGPRRARLVAFAALVALQLTIAATGNFTFFNLLSMLLCVPLLDDEALAALGTRRRGRSLEPGAWPEEEGASPGVLARAARVAGIVAWIALALPLAAAGGATMAGRLAGPGVVPGPLSRLVEVLEPWHVTNSYGLFAVMTRQRREIVIEGTEDGTTWHEYPMRWKPGDPHAAPAFVAPHQPRLDWQMWFAALGDWRRSPWLVEVQKKLLARSPAVLDLFADDPFDGRAPRQVRAVAWDYRFTDWKTREETGAWWSRRPLGPWSPAVSR